MSTDANMVAPGKVDCCITHPDMATKHHTEQIDAGIVGSRHQYSDPAKCLLLYIWNLTIQVLDFWCHWIQVLPPIWRLIVVFPIEPSIVRSRHGHLPEDWLLYFENPMIQILNPQHHQVRPGVVRLLHYHPSGGWLLYCCIEPKPSGPCEHPTKGLLVFFKNPMIRVLNTQHHQIHPGVIRLEQSHPGGDWLLYFCIEPKLLDPYSIFRSWYWHLAKGLLLYF